MSRGGRGDSQSRVVGYRRFITRADEQRVERLLKQAQIDGVITQYDCGNADGGALYWWNGPPSKAMRALRDAIGGTPVADG